MTLEDLIDIIIDMAKEVFKRSCAIKPEWAYQIY